MRRILGPGRAIAAASAAGRGLLTEVTCTTEATCRWAQGFGPERVTRPAPTATPAATPVMLIHGLGANKSYFAKLERQLSRAGYTVYSVNYPWMRSTIADSGTHIAEEAARLLAETEASRVHLVAHSLGGLLLRWALANTALADRVGVAITLGSPHRGTVAARLASTHTPLLGTLIQQLRPEAAALRDLAHPGDVPQVRLVAVAGALDWVVPWRSALLPEYPNVRNVVLPNTGHVALAAHPDVIRLILDELDHADHAASTAA